MTGDLLISLADSRERVCPGEHLGDLFSLRFVTVAPFGDRLCLRFLPGESLGEGVRLRDLDELVLGDLLLLRLWLLRGEA